MKKTVAVLVALVTVIGSSPALAAPTPPVAAFQGAPDVGGGTFVDDDDSIFQNDIEALFAEGVTKGCNKEGTSFCPGGNVTRGQMAAFLVRALGYTDVDPDISFSDTAASPFLQDILKLATAGVTTGCGNGEFCPADFVTRGQMAAFLVRALELSDIDPDISFNDTSASPFETEILKLATAGITAGCGGGGFCPGKPVTRGQMAAFLVRAFDYPRPSILPRQQTIEGTPLGAVEAAIDAGCPFDNGMTCTATVEIPEGEVWHVEEGWFQALWSTLTAAEQAQFGSSDLSTEISLNGTVLDTWTDGVVYDPVFDVARKLEAFQFGATMTGTHTVTVVFIDNITVPSYSVTVEITVVIAPGVGLGAGAGNKEPVPLQFGG